ncbi:MAG: MerR family transcriptional regulator [Acidovorax sp.]|jgi:DNA-binding transcriptional MerR regulator|nr:MerR family transcriptional regulator [Acidovorax sp.]
MFFKIGALARRTGLTVRTLHHYDEIGLLVPSHRSEAGFRMYNRDDLARLHQIQALKQLGFGLAQIGETLAHNGVSLEHLIAQQIAALDRQLEQTTRLRTQLLRLKAVMDCGETPEMADFLVTLELMTMHEKYFTPDELKRLEQHRRDAGTDLDQCWATLVQAMRGLMERGVDPAQPEVQQYVAEWTALAQKTTGGDPGLLIKLDRMTRNEQSAQQQSGIDKVLLDYVMRGIAAAHAAIYAKYLTTEELERVMRGRAQTQSQWPPLVAAMRQQFSEGAAPDTPAVQALAVEWKRLFDITHEGDDGTLKAKLYTAYTQEPGLLRGTGLDFPLLHFAGQAMAALPAA